MYMVSLAQLLRPGYARPVVAEAAASPNADSHAQCSVQ
jgi:hypothetical protein